MAKSFKSKLIILITCIVLLFIVSLLVVKNNKPASVEENLKAGKYQSAVDNLKLYLSAQGSVLFLRDDFKALKSFLTLPLQIGLVGNSDPFFIEDLSESLINPLLIQ